MQIDPMGFGSPLSPEHKTRLRRLAWATVRRFVLAASGAVGAKIGERAVEWLFGETDSDDDGEDTDPGGDE